MSPAKFKARSSVSLPGCVKSVIARSISTRSGSGFCIVMLLVCSFWSPRQKKWQRGNSKDTDSVWFCYWINFSSLGGPLLRAANIWELRSVALLRGALPVLPSHLCFRSAPLGAFTDLWEVGFKSVLTHPRNTGLLTAKHWAI